MVSIFDIDRLKCPSQSVSLRSQNVVSFVPNAALIVIIAVMIIMICIHLR